MLYLFASAYFLFEGLHALVKPHGYGSKRYGIVLLVLSVVCASLGESYWQSLFK